jgi:MFS family permease
MPNLVFPLFGGFFVDKYGLETMLTFFSILTVLGQFVVFLGAYQNYYALMCVGRFVFGSGAESLLMLQVIDISRWFNDKDYTLAIGISQFVSYSITLTSGYISPRILKKCCLVSAMGFGALVALSSLVFVYFYI